MMHMQYSSKLGHVVAYFWQLLTKLRGKLTLGNILFCTIFLIGVSLLLNISHTRSLLVGLACLINLGYQEVCNESSSLSYCSLVVGSICIILLKRKTLLILSKLPTNPKVNAWTTSRTAQNVNFNALTNESQSETTRQKTTDPSDFEQPNDQENRPKCQELITSSIKSEVSDRIVKNGDALKKRNKRYMDDRQELRHIPHYDVILSGSNVTSVDKAKAEGGVKCNYSLAGPPHVETVYTQTDHPVTTSCYTDAATMTDGLELKPSVQTSTHATLTEHEVQDVSMNVALKICRNSSVITSGPFMKKLRRARRILRDTKTKVSEEHAKVTQPWKIRLERYQQRIKQLTNEMEKKDQLIGVTSMARVQCEEQLRAVNYSVRVSRDKLETQQNLNNELSMKILEKTGLPCNQR